MASGSETVVRTTSIPVTFSRGVSNNALDVSTYTHIVRDGGTAVESYVAYESVISSNARSLLFGSVIITITKVDLEFWHHEADLSTPVKDLEFVELTNQPSSRSGAQLEADISAGGATVYTTNETHGIRKTKETVTLGTGSSADVCTRFSGALSSGASSRWISVGIRRLEYVGDEDVLGDVDLGGIELVSGTGTEWRDKDDANDQVVGLPRFIITWESTIVATSIGRTETRYTTLDPTTQQNTPLNSIGGFIASNEVYTSGQISDFVNATQTTIDLEDETTIPETSGLAHLGAEIFKYGSVDANNSTLLNITRGISPGASFPSGLQPFSEYCYFLELDRLFDTKPTIGMSQYRCVGIVNTGFDTESVEVILRQNTSSTVQSEVGIEVPEYNSRTFILAANVTTDTVLTSTSTTVTEFKGSQLPSSSDLFDGGYMTVGSTVVEILSFATDAGAPATATFVIDQSVTATAGDSIVIHSAPSQRLANDSTAPTENSGRFFGFIPTGSSELSYSSIREGVNTFSRNEEFYIWIRRTLKSNAEETNDTGAVLVFRYRDTT